MVLSVVATEGCVHCQSFQGHVRSARSMIGLLFYNNFLNLFTATSLSLVYSLDLTASPWSAILKQQINIPHSLHGASCED